MKNKIAFWTCLLFALFGLLYCASIHAWPEPTSAAEVPITWTFEGPADQWIDSTELPDGKGGIQRVPVTGYTSHAAQTDSTPCIAADGSDICARYARGEKICATNDWPMGSILTVESMGTCTVADRMNRRYTGTGRVDWYFGMDIGAARKHGIKNLFVEAE